MVKTKWKRKRSFQLEYTRLCAYYKNETVSVTQFSQLGMPFRMVWMWNELFLFFTKSFFQAFNFRLPEILLLKMTSFKLQKLSRNSWVMYAGGNNGCKITKYRANVPMVMEPKSKSFRSISYALLALLELYNFKTTFHLN